MLKFLADESCDFSIVRSLRKANYDVNAIAEETPGISDLEVLKKARKEERILLTEDKDFGEWIYAHGSEISGVIFFRYPSSYRQHIAAMPHELIKLKKEELVGSFTVVEPGRFRVRKDLK